MGGTCGTHGVDKKKSTTFRLEIKIRGDHSEDLGELGRKY
jgi:hypothetical protein